MLKTLRSTIPYRLPIILALTICFCDVSNKGWAVEKSLLSIDDIYRFDAPTDAVYLPGGRSAVFVRRWNDRATKTQRFSLWRIAENGQSPEPMELGEPDARQPVLSPDGKWIAFYSTRSFADGTPAFPSVPVYSEPACHIWLIPSAGGKAIPLADKNKPFGRVLSDRFYAHLAFSPDGKRLVFVADDGRDPRTQAEKDNNVSIVREDQGEIYEGYGNAQIWIADLRESPGEVAASKVTRLTDDAFWYGDPNWSPDGKSIVVHANRTDDQESVTYSINKNYDLWQIDVATRERKQLTTDPGPEVSPRYSPDGNHVVCLSSPRKGPHADVFNVLAVDLSSAGPQSRVAYGAHDANGDGRNHPAPLFPLSRKSWNDSRSLDIQVMDRSNVSTVTVSVDGNSDDDPPGNNFLRPTFLPPSNTFLNNRRIARDEVVRWKSFDGQEIEGVLTLPPEGVANKPYKLLLYPHGGPHSRSAPGFNFTVQIFAAHGYAVFQPNFRGSVGYGRKFLDADRFDLGGGDMRDILTGIDHLVEQKIIDPKRQFVYGISYGGFTTCWLIGHTNQFRAAVPQNAVTDLNVMWGLSDIQSWTEWEFGGRPWEVPAAMREHSPITYAASIRTPTLILHADHDRRCPLAMGQMFFRTLKKAGVETQMVIYPDERHAISQLPHQQDVLRRVLDWFAAHDLGAENKSPLK